MEESSKECTAFISPFGKFQFTQIPFGLKNTPTFFQRLMESVLSPCYSFSAPYMDDVLIFSKNWEEHLTHVGAVLGQLWRHGLTTKPSKCEWGMCHVETKWQFQK